VKFKKNGKVRYWIQFRIPGTNQQRKEFVGMSIEEAKAADGKRKVQKHENRIFDMLPEGKMNFSELAKWYLELAPVKKLASYRRVKQVLANFNQVFGEKQIGSIKPMEIEEYQAKREKDGAAPATIDMEISIAKTMITKAFDNDLVDGRAVKAFRNIKRKLKKSANARKRTLSICEYLRLCDVAPPHLRAVLTTAFNTGMRAGELRLLQWTDVDKNTGFIRLPESKTKERKKKVIPINQNVKDVLDGLPRALHHDFVFTYLGEPISYRCGLRRSFTTACNKAGIVKGRSDPDGFVFHDIRHTVKTNMLSAGVKKEYRDLILGHSFEGMDAFYINPSDGDLKAAMELYTAWLDEQIRAARQTAELGNMGNIEA
ncbi:MAG: site-specific integrase, partial [Syntrophobacter sp.]